MVNELTNCDAIRDQRRIVRQMLAITNAKYGASSDFTSIAKVLEEWAGVEMRG